MQLKDNQQFDVNVEGRDAHDHVAQFENPQFTASDPAVGTFTVDPTNPQKGTFKAAGPGACKLTFVADGIQGEGESLVNAELDITVLSGDAITAVITAGVATDQ